MASMTSVISFLILLLATYSYSAPTVTPGYEFTTDTIMVEHQTPANLVLLNDKDSVSVPNIHKPRSFDSEESTTFESQKREFEESTDESKKREFEESTDESKKREFEESTDESKKREFEESTDESKKREFEESTDESKKREFEESTTFGSQKREFEESTDESKKREFDESTTFGTQKREFEESTDESKKREVSESSEESTTDESKKREFDEFSSSTVEPVKREFEESSSTVESRKRIFSEDSTPYMDTAAKFNGRVINGVYEEQPEGQEHSDVQEQPEAGKPVQSLSSVDAEAGQTGLLNNGAAAVYPTNPINPNSESVQYNPLKIYKSISKSQSSSQSSSQTLTSFTSVGYQRPQFIEKH